jgi:hypothetical protein
MTHFTRQYISEDNSEHHTRSRENLKSHMFTLLSHLRIRLPSLLLPLDLQTKICKHPTSTHVQYIPSLLQSPSVQHPSNARCRAQTMELLIMQFSPACCHFIPPGSKYSPMHPFLKHPHLCSSLNVRNQVSHPYKTAVTLQRWLAYFKSLRCYTAHVKTKCSAALGTKHCALRTPETTCNELLQYIRHSSRCHHFQMVY